MWFRLLYLFGGLAAATDPLRNGPTIIQSKGLLIEHSTEIAATEYIHLKIRANLPNMDWFLTEVPKPCHTLRQDDNRFTPVCYHLDRSIQTARNLLFEIRRLFKNSDSPMRARRSLFPVIGKIRSFLEGTATVGQLDTVVTNINSLGTDLEAIRNKTNKLIQNLGDHEVAINGLSTNVSQRLQEFAKAHNNLTRIVQESQTQGDIVFGKFVVLQHLSQAIDLLTIHTIELRAIFQSCQKHKLNRIAVNETQLGNILYSKKLMLNAARLGLAIELKDIQKYYLLETAHCRLLDRALEYDFYIPIVPTTGKWAVLLIKPIKFLLDSKTCTLFDHTVKVATNGDAIRPMPLSAGNSLVSLIPRFAEDSKLPPCIHSILTSTNLITIRENCPVSCSESEETTV